MSYTNNNKSSPKEILLDTIKDNIKSSFRDGNDRCYVTFSNGITTAADSDLATRIIRHKILGTDLFCKIDEKTTKDLMLSYINVVTHETKAIFNRTGIKFDENNQVESLYIKHTQSQVVKITKDEWKTINNLDEQDVLFSTTASALDMPSIAEDGNVHDINFLKEIINYGSDNDFKLIVAWIVYTFFPGEYGSKPLLVFQAEQGSGKSKASQFLKQIIDPDKYPLSTIKTEEDIMLLAKHDWLTVLDNVSYIKHDLSDILCRLATGGSFKTRKHYTNDEIHAVSFKKPLILNGINAFIRNSDLADRCVYINLPVIKNRTPESELNRKFEALRPKIFTAILHILVKVLEILPTITLDGLPRLRDFTRVGIAVEKVLGWQDGEFLSIDQANSKEMVYATMEGDSLLGAIVYALDMQEG